MKKSNFKTTKLAKLLSYKIDKPSEIINRIKRFFFDK